MTIEEKGKRIVQDIKKETGINPVKIYVEHEYVRCVKGGTGRAKAGGNYAASLIGQKRAEEMGYAQVLWLDGIHRKYIDEVGAPRSYMSCIRSSLLR